MIISSKNRCKEERFGFIEGAGSSAQDTSIVYLSSRSCVSIDRKSISFADNGAVQDPEAGLHDERAACLQARPQKGKRIKYPSKKRVHMHGS